MYIIKTIHRVQNIKVLTYIIECIVNNAIINLIHAIIHIKYSKSKENIYYIGFDKISITLTFLRVIQ